MADSDFVEDEDGSVLDSGSSLPGPEHRRDGSSWPANDAVSKLSPLVDSRAIRHEHVSTDNEHVNGFLDEQFNKLNDRDRHNSAGQRVQHGLPVVRCDDGFGQHDDDSGHGDSFKHDDRVGAPDAGVGGRRSSNDG